MAGLVAFPFEQAKTVLANYRELAASAPRELNAWVILRKAPPLPFLPENVHGKEIVAVAVFHAGPRENDDEMAQRVRALGKAQGEHLGRQPYAQWQQTFDPLLAAGARNYWKSHNFKELSDGAVDTMVEYAGRLPSPHCEIFVGLIGGAANDVPADATAWGHRDARPRMSGASAGRGHFSRRRRRTRRAGRT
jgi:hypothetical protein